jgi:hypothetical protein
LHKEGDVLFCSPNNGHFTVKSPDVRFRLEVETGERSWRFEVRLLSNVKLNFPLERYAWVRLGKPNIDGIGERFVNEIGES